jgi:hypothetical protein
MDPSFFKNLCLWKQKNTGSRNFRYFSSAVAILGLSLGGALFAHGGSYVVYFAFVFVFTVAVFIVSSCGIFSCVIFRHGSFSILKDKFTEDFSSAFIFRGFSRFIHKQKRRINIHVDKIALKW